VAMVDTYTDVARVAVIAAIEGAKGRQIIITREDSV